MDYNNKIQNRIYWVYIAGLVLILTLPILSIAPMFHPPAWGKTIVFRIVFSILLFIFIYQVLFKKYSPDFANKVGNLKSKKSAVFWPFWLLIALLGIYFLATIFSMEFTFSMWGSPYRSGGFVNYAFYILLAVLTFLIIKENDWLKIWDFSFFIGAIVAILGIFQKFKILEGILAVYSYRPVSTIGGSIFLALYLLLLTILSFSFGLKSRGFKRIFYFACFALYIFVIMLTATRSVILGIGIGFLFFIFFLPYRIYNPKRIKQIKIAFALILIVMILGIIWLRNYPNFTQKLEENKTFGVFFSRIWAVTGRFSLQQIFSSRGDGWKVGIEAVKDRPILGYGPENFSIGFDKYYDSKLAGISREPGGASSTSWWDKGHNFLIDQASNAGITGLAIFLIFISVLFWQLQKAKNRTESKNRKIIIHGIQATFIAHLSALFFGFDLFSTYLISFLLVGYSFFLINQSQAIETETYHKNKIRPYQDNLWKPVFIFLLFFLLIWFIWQYNFKLLYVNKETNIAVFLTNQQYCDQGMAVMEPLLSYHTVIDNHIGLQYIDIITECLRYQPERKLELSQKATSILDGLKESRPTYTRTWHFAGVYYTKILEGIQEEGKQLTPEIKNELNEKARLNFEKSHELSPGRQKLYSDLARLDLALENFEEAYNNSQKCIEMNPYFADCWWVKALAEINLGRMEQATESIETADEYGYPLHLTTVLGQLINIYGKMAKLTGQAIYYQALVGIYQKMIAINPANFQYHASLAYVYKMLGKYDKAREEAMIVLDMSPESRPNVEEFLRSLPY